MVCQSPATLSIQLFCNTSLFVSFEKDELECYRAFVWKGVSKLVYLSKPKKVTDSIRHLAYYNICLFSVNYESVMLYSTGPSVVNTVGLLSLNSCFRCDQIYKCQDIWLWSHIVELLMSDVGLTSTSELQARATWHASIAILIWTVSRVIMKTLTSTSQTYLLFSMGSHFGQSERPW